MRKMIYNHAFLLLSSNYRVTSAVVDILINFQVFGLRYKILAKWIYYIYNRHKIFISTEILTYFGILDRMFNIINEREN